MPFRAFSEPPKAYPLLAQTAIRSLVICAIKSAGALLTWPALTDLSDLRFVTRRVRGQSSVTVTNWKNTRADLIVDLQRLVGALEATHEIADLQAAYRQFCRSASAHEIATLLYFTGRQYGGNSSVDWTQYW